MFTRDYPEPILVKGLKDMNRAISGDQVAIQILPKDQWKRSSARAVDEGTPPPLSLFSGPVFHLPSPPPFFLPSSDVLNPEEVHEEPEEEKGPEEDTAMTENPIKPTGRVVGILRRNARQYCGSVDEATADSEAEMGELRSVIFVPVDKRIPRVKIQTRQIENLLNQRIAVAIDSWDTTSRSPVGHFVRVIGAVGDREVETEVILLEHDVPFQPFSEAVRACLPSNSWTVEEQPKEEARVDLRHLDVCSVDPPGCTDIDDALHVRELPNGNYEIGVHIADVSHFVRPGNPMDREAAKRGTTVYLVDRRIDMLPELLGSSMSPLFFFRFCPQSP